MSELQMIEATVARAGRRRRWQRAWQGFWRGLLAGGSLWLLALALYKLLPLPFTSLGVAAALALAVTLGGFLVGWFRRDPPLATARWLDQSQHLQERLSTALEVRDDPRAGAWRDLVIGDAARHVAQVNLKRLLPFHLPTAARWTLLVLTLGAGLGFVPEYRSREYLARQHEKEVVRETGKNLAEVSRRALERRTPTLESARQAVQSVGQLGEQLARNPVTRNEALRELARASTQVRQESQELSRNPALRSMERAARTSGANDPASAEQLRKQIESLQQAAGTRPPNPDALEKLRQELQKARQAAASLMDRNATANDAARESLAQSLSNLSRQSTELGNAMPSLEQALEALEAGAIDQVLKNLQVAEKDLEKLLEMAQTLQQLQQQAARMGRDLAEQLKNGQGEAAIGTLQKMINQLKAGNASAEQLKAMMDELNKALDPASPYGKVPDHLKQALSDLRAGQQGAAAQSLGQAAKELEELLQQLADAQDLQSTLESLQKAQACIGNAQGYAQGLGRPSAKPGGKPGRGVGTWADEEGWIEPPESTGLWDNSGIERPDLDPRGITDRGEGELPEGMAPTKVKGQFQPGAQMPSITLRGVSIKGQSTVGVQEAIQAAQSSAESALSHDQVPRAYQGAVKSYFDDLPTSAPPQTPPPER